MVGIFSQTFAEDHLDRGAKSERQNREKIRRSKRRPVADGDTLPGDDENTLKVINYDRIESKTDAIESVNEEVPNVGKKVNQAESVSGEEAEKIKMETKSPKIGASRTGISDEEIDQMSDQLVEAALPGAKLAKTNIDELVRQINRESLDNGKNEEYRKLINGILDDNSIHSKAERVKRLQDLYYQLRQVLERDSKREGLRTKDDYNDLYIKNPGLEDVHKEIEKITRRINAKSKELGEKLGLGEKINVEYKNSINMIVERTSVDLEEAQDRVRRLDDLEDGLDAKINQ
jgi:hypothetical protein